MAISNDEVLYIFDSLVKILEDLIEYDIYTCDLKPENIRLDYKNNDKNLLVIKLGINPLKFYNSNNSKQTYPTCFTPLYYDEITLLKIISEPDSIKRSHRLQSELYTLGRTMMEIMFNEKKYNKNLLNNPK